MFLIFQLRRLDVWPVETTAFARLRAGLRLEAAADPRSCSLGERFRPYRTVAAWFAGEQSANSETAQVT